VRNEKGFLVIPSDVNIKKIMKDCGFREVGGIESASQTYPENIQNKVE